MCTSIDCSSQSQPPLEALQLAALYEEIAPFFNPATVVQNALYKYRADAKLAEGGLVDPNVEFVCSPGSSRSDTGIF